MALTIYDVIKSPVTASTKANMLNQKFQKLMVYVHDDATKAQIKEAVQKLFNVKVVKVNTLTTGDKARRAGQHIVVRSGKKKAIITLKKGQALNLLNPNGTGEVVMPEVMPSSTDTV